MKRHVVHSRGVIFLVRISPTFLTCSLTKSGRVSGFIVIIRLALSPPVVISFRQHGSNVLIVPNNKKQFLLRNLLVKEEIKYCI